MLEFTPDYWNNRYQQKDTPWDTKAVTTPIKEYFDAVEYKNLRILIPGAGAGHEAIYLFEQGFRNVYICDWAVSAFEQFKINCPDFPRENILIGDFFDLDIKVDIVVEQTFFCAIQPTQRVEYAQKVAQLLQTNGKLVGLLFATPFSHKGPPFGGTKEEYINIFQPHFNIHTIDIAKNSIKPRAGSEYFIEMVKLG